MVKLTAKDKKKIRELRSFYPDIVKVKVSISKEGGFIAEIFPFDCGTQAETFSELIEMVNDAIKTYLEVPRKLVKFMPTYIPPVEEAQRFSVYPLPARKRILTFCSAQCP